MGSYFVGKEYRDRTDKFLGNHTYYILSHCYNLHKEYMDSEYETTRKLLQVFDMVTIKKEYEKDSEKYSLGIYSITEYYHPSLKRGDTYSEYELECDLRIVDKCHTDSDTANIKFRINGNRGGSEVLKYYCEITGIHNIANSGVRLIKCDAINCCVLGQLRDTGINLMCNKLYLSGAVDDDIKLIGKQTYIDTIHTDYASFCLLVRNISNVKTTIETIILTVDDGYRENRQLSKEEFLNFLSVYFSHGGNLIRFFDGPLELDFYAEINWRIDYIKRLNLFVDGITEEDIIEVKKLRG